MRYNIQWVKEREQMRVITGAARGRKLQTPRGLEVRPTTDAVKESVFSIIQFSVEGRAFLDAFAGSGQMGIEALSRGASHAVFLDSAGSSLEAVRKNLAATGLAGNAEVIAADTLQYLSHTAKRFDLVYLDPPYETGLLQQALQLLPRVMNKGGMILCEHPAHEEMPEAVGDYQRKKSYKYGKICVTVYSHKEVEGI